MSPLPSFHGPKSVAELKLSRGEDALVEQVYRFHGPKSVAELKLERGTLSPGVWFPRPQIRGRIEADTGHAPACE